MQLQSLRGAYQQGYLLSDDGGCCIDTKGPLLEALGMVRYKFAVLSYEVRSIQLCRVPYAT